METRQNNKIWVKKWSIQRQEHPKSAHGFHGFKRFNANNNITIVVSNKHNLIYMNKKKIVGTDFLKFNSDFIFHFLTPQKWYSWNTPFGAPLYPPHSVSMATEPYSVYYI